MTQIGQEKETKFFPNIFGSDLRLSAFTSGQYLPFPACQPEN
jgi:hypothetical protein